MTVIPGLVPGTQKRGGAQASPERRRFWMAGTSPAMTTRILRGAYLSFSRSPMAAWAAARRAIGTRYAEQLT
jgi:hypothetical protein